VIASTEEVPPALPWAQVPHWVMLAPISLGAKMLYVLLLMHVDRRDPNNRRAWPSRASLARMANFSRPQTVDQYIAELELIGAVRVERGGRHELQPLRRQNYYHVVLPCDPAPTGIEFLDLKGFYEKRREEAANAAGRTLWRTSGDAPERTSQGAPERTGTRCY
jgi:hypothetical protein